MATTPNDPRSKLASVAVVLDHPRVAQLAAQHSRPLVLDAVRDALDAYRGELKPTDDAPGLDAIVQRVESLLQLAEFDRLRYVVNATGVLLHTNLGRAVLPQTAVDGLEFLGGCCNLQVDLATGLRGKRNHVSEQLLCRLTGAEAAMIVNNNAAATWLILAALCPGKDVVVSRGQLIEIGGSFRLPDCIHLSGARMVEVGTTNKTHLRDYERAITEDTAALLRVNPSNYRIVGFTKDVPVADLATLKDQHEVLVIDDLGCGALIDLVPFGLPHEPTVPDSIAAGADIVCFSGDKLVGGPQAGIIVGKKALIAQIKQHPFTRMLRACKMTDLALERALRLFLDPDTLLERHPTLRMLTAPVDALKRKANRIKRCVEKAGSGLALRVVDGTSEMGGGSLPGVSIPTALLAVSSDRCSADGLNAALRQSEPPIIARIKDDEVLLDMRTLLDGEDRIAGDALERIAAP